jgi:hypothetical protein
MHPERSMRNSRTGRKSRVLIFIPFLQLCATSAGDPFRKHAASQRPGTVSPPELRSKNRMARRRIRGEHGVSAQDARPQARGRRPRGGEGEWTGQATKEDGSR